MRPYQVVYLFMNMKKLGANVIITNNREAIQRGSGNESQELEKWANWEMTRARRNFRVRRSVAVEAQAGRGRRPRFAIPARLHQAAPIKVSLNAALVCSSSAHLPLSSPDWQAGGRASDDDDAAESSINQYRNFVLFCERQRARCTIFHHTNNNISM
jgi:hypothetical protein